MHRLEIEINNRIRNELYNLARKQQEIIISKSEKCTNNDEWKELKADFIIYKKLQYKLQGGKRCMMERRKYIKVINNEKRMSTYINFESIDTIEDRIDSAIITTLSGQQFWVKATADVILQSMYRLDTDCVFANVIEFEIKY